MSAAPSCRICGSRTVVDTGLRTCEDISEVGTFFVYDCQNCFNGFTHPEAPKEMFELRPDIQAGELRSGFATVLNLLLDLRIKRIERLLQATKLDILDIGGGACAFSNRLARRGHRVTVVEPNLDNEQFVDKAAGVKFIGAFFSDDLIRETGIAFQSFDCVTMWHSLEHMPEPHGILASIRKVLRPGGTLFISVPNFKGLLAKIGGQYWTYLDVPHHAYHFTARGLERLLVQAGFRVRQRFHFSWEYDPFGWFQTLLNLTTRSHNYFYNLTKKGGADTSYLKYPRWTKAMTSAGFMILPLAILMMAAGWLLRAPSCIEVAAQNEAV